MFVCMLVMMRQKKLPDAKMEKCTDISLVLNDILHTLFHCPRSVCLIERETRMYLIAFMFGTPFCITLFISPSFIIFIQFLHTYLVLLVLDFAFYAFVSTLFAISFFVRVIRLILESVNFDEYTAVSRPKLNCDRYGNKKVVMVVILLWVGIGAPDHQER